MKLEDQNLKHTNFTEVMPILSLCSAFSVWVLEGEQGWELLSSVSSYRWRKPGTVPSFIRWRKPGAQSPHSYRWRKQDRAVKHPVQ